MSDALSHKVLSGKAKGAIAIVSGVAIHNMNKGKGRRAAQRKIQKEATINPAEASVNNNAMPYRNAYDQSYDNSYNNNNLYAAQLAKDMSTYRYGKPMTGFL